MLLNTYEWTENPDGSWSAQRRDVTIRLVRVWDAMRQRQSWEYFYERPGDGASGSGIARSADLEEAKREAERMANWRPGAFWPA